MKALLTGTRETAGETGTYLASRGWNVTVLPLIETVPVPQDTWQEEIRSAFRAADPGTCVVTSKRAAQDLALFLGDHPLPDTWDILAIGEETGHVLGALHVHCTVLPNAGTAADSLRDAGTDLSRRRVLLIGARLMDMRLAEAVGNCGGMPHHIVTYDTLTPEETYRTLRSCAQDHYDLGIFWSASAARAYCTALDTGGAPALRHAVALGRKAGTLLTGRAPSIHIPETPDTPALLELLRQLTDTITTDPKEHP